MSLEHERTLCAKVFIDESVLDCGVEPEDFSDPFCHNVWNIARGLREKRVPIDLISVRDADARILPDALSSLTDCAYSAADHAYYAGEVIKAANGRKLTRIGMALATDAETDPEAAAERAEKALLEMSHRGKKYDIASPKEYVPIWTKYYKDIASRGGMVGCPTGMAKLDEAFGGFQNRRFYIIGGRPSDGKSALLLQFAQASARAGKNVGIISAESAREEVYTRMVSHQTRIDGRMMFILGEQLPTRQKGDMLTTLKWLSDTNAIHIWDRPNPDMREVVSVARHMKAAMKIDALFVDYIQLLQTKGAKDRTEAAARASLGLKELSRELDIPVVAAAQLRRDDENRRPHLGSFQWADQLGQDADVALMIHHSTKDGDEESRLLLEKVRDGRTGVVDVVFRRDIVTFEEKARQ
jgi:replicative DNA helicase